MLKKQAEMGQGEKGENSEGVCYLTSERREREKDSKEERQKKSRFLCSKSKQRGEGERGKIGDIKTEGRKAKKETERGKKGKILIKREKETIARLLHFQREK